MDWDASMALEARTNDHYRGHVGEDWSSLQGVHGGVVAALMLGGVDHSLAARDISADTVLRSATFGYVSGNRVGDVDIEVEIIRLGRSMISSHVTVRQEGKITTVARMHHSTPWDGPVYSDAPPPPPRPERTERLHIADRTAHLNNVATELDHGTVMFGGADRAEWRAWSRPLHGGAFDAKWLVMFGDYFPPAVMAKETTPQRAVTIEYSIQIHQASAAWDLGSEAQLAARMHTFHSHDGFAVEDGWIYLPDGALLATCRQTRLAGG